MIHEICSVSSVYAYPVVIRAFLLSQCIPPSWPIPPRTLVIQEIYPTPKLDYEYYVSLFTAEYKPSFCRDADEWIYNRYNVPEEEKKTAPPKLCSVMQNAISPA
jgi:hypothetical protein